MFNGVGIGVGLCGTTPGINNPANLAPAVTTSGGTTAYTQNAAAVVVDAALTVDDADDANLEGATVEITSGFETGDVLAGSNGSGITWSWNAGTHVLTGSGSASKATWQTKLREVTFAGTSAEETPRVVTFKVDDGEDESAGATKGIAYAAGPPEPSLTMPTSQEFTEASDNSMPQVSVTYEGSEPLECRIACSGLSLYMTGGSGATITGDGTSSVLIEGTREQIEVAFTPGWQAIPVALGVYFVEIGIRRAGQSSDADADTIEVTVVPFIPAGVGGSRGASNPSTSIDVTWTDNTTQADGIEVWRNGAKIADVALGIQAHTDTGLTIDTTYSYDVRSYKVVTPDVGEPYRVVSAFAGSTDITTNRAPVIDGGATAELFEAFDSAAAFYPQDIGSPLSYSDPEEDTSIWSIVGGAQSSYFSIDPFTGQLAWVAAPIEVVNEVIVQADDGHGGTDTQQVIVNFTELG